MPQAQISERGVSSPKASQIDKTLKTLRAAITPDLGTVQFDENPIELKKSKRLIIAIEQIFTDSTFDPVQFCSTQTEMDRMKKIVAFIHHSGHFTCNG